MDKDAVLQEELEAGTSLAQAVQDAPPGLRSVDGVVPGWTIHDTLWHVAYWVNHAADIIEAARPGEPFPEEPEEGEYYDAKNAETFPQGRTLGWDDVVAHFEQGRERARQALAGCDEANGDAAADRVMEEVEHYREHDAQIRAFVHSHSGIALGYPS
ncbi:MAG: maleylpyruvate isomerase N-terminal domain-containing protein [Actinomycetota bacterium]